jgi:hypothetical protein
VKGLLPKINLKVLWHHKMAVQSIMAVRFLAFKKVSILELVCMCVCVVRAREKKRGNKRGGAGVILIMSRL